MYRFRHIVHRYRDKICEGWLSTYTGIRIWPTNTGVDSDLCICLALANHVPALLRWARTRVREIVSHKRIRRQSCYRDFLSLQVMISPLSGGTYQHSPAAPSPTAAALPSVQMHPWECARSQLRCPHGQGDAYLRSCRKGCPTLLGPLAPLYDPMC